MQNSIADGRLVGRTIQYGGKNAKTQKSNRHIYVVGLARAIFNRLKTDHSRALFLYCLSKSVDEDYRIVSKTTQNEMLDSRLIAKTRDMRIWFEDYVLNDVCRSTALHTIYEGLLDGEDLECVQVLLKGVRICSDGGVPLTAIELPITLIPEVFDWINRGDLFLE
jgi:hypothetical protein